ncbi:hypothetical protein PanWU01x14_351910 [Parasponia andersonii]|uniref:Uncharacterized protein n=1 Tax=Parasponia andersonii TaxID=3476 RepID=A0A2P5AAH6_PARAD|nr:hypothetical protein PanWU01x14_351910 [Parasponia andersonii]
MVNNGQNYRVNNNSFTINKLDFVAIEALDSRFDLLQCVQSWVFPFVLLLQRSMEGLLSPISQCSREPTMTKLELRHQ